MDDSHGAIQEMDEEYDDSSMEDEDELNHRIQAKSSHLPDPGASNELTRCQTEPHGDLSQYQHEYKNNKDKHISKKKKNGKHSTSKSKKSKKKQPSSNGHSMPPKQTKLTKSVSHSSVSKKSRHSNQSYKRDDVEDVDIQSISGDDEYQDVLNQTINEDEAYLDMSITAEDYANQSQSLHSKETPTSKPTKRNTLDFVKSGLMSAKKRLLSPDKMAASGNANNGHYTAKDSPVSTSMSSKSNGYPPTSPDDSHQLTHSLSQHSNSEDANRKDSNTPNSHSKKGSVSQSLFGGLSKKGLFGRTANNKVDVNKSSDDEKNAAQHKKTESKTNLSSIKAKFQGLTKSYSSKNMQKELTEANQNMESRKVEKKKKSSKKKQDVSSMKGGNKSNNIEQVKRKKAKSEAKPMRRNRSASTQKNKPSKSSSKSSSNTNGSQKKQKGTDSSIKAPPKREMRIKPKEDTQLKRHSMQPMARSRSMKPSRSQANIADRRNRHTTNSPDHLPLERSASNSKGKLTRKSASNLNDHSKQSLKMRKSYSEMNGGGKDKKMKSDAFKRDSSKKKKSNNNLGVDDKESRKRRSKSGGGGDYNTEDERKQAKERKQKELERSMLAADKKCKYRIKNEIFELYEYYKPIRLIGSGAYAVVCEAIDERTKKRVAIKKNKHIFDDIRDARRILREIKLLLHFNRYKHPDLIEIYDSLPPTVAEIQDFEDVYIVMPLLESNLCKIITSKQKLSNLHYQYLTYQVLRGLKFIHEAGVIHRDIKPENILLNGNDCDVKIIDFGLARGVLGQEGEDNPENAKATEYVCTRWYRSPEVMCSGGRYDEKMDIWGVGCILAEMILRRPLFPGANYLDQLQQIFDIMGTPKATEWILNDQARSWVQKLPKHNGKNLKKMIAHKFEDTTQDDLDNCTDLLYKLLELNPADRISAADSLSHPYFKEMHDEEEVLSGEKFDLSFEFEQSIKTKFGVRHMMYSALDEYHKKQWHRIRKKQKRKEQKEREKAKKEKEGGKNGGKSSSKHSDSKHRKSSKHSSSSKHHKHRSSKHKNKE